MRERVVRALLDLAERLGSIQDGSEWYLFGSVDRDEPAASDIDLLILCTSDEQADALRREIDPDDLPLPLDLALMTFGEAAQVDAVRTQSARLIHPHPSRQTT
jgi:predicted nucleotidyltransferase